MKTILLIFFAALSLAAGCVSHIPLKQSCPDEWYKDEMPGTFSDDHPREYFVVNGKRAEVSDYDIKWVEKNCSVKKQVVS